ncbi:MAG: hypothetical protein LBR15_02440 [Methanobrevibacter sp.]|jgi:hypothetical protein|nr:hypothetical protein [Candidatus Methanovirga australis]
MYRGGLSALAVAATAYFGYKLHVFSTGNIGVNSQALLGPTDIVAGTGLTVAGLGKCVFGLGLVGAAAIGLGITFAILDSECKVHKDGVTINRVSTSDDDAYVGDNVTIDLSVTGPTKLKSPILDGRYDISINNKNIDKVPFKDGNATINHTVGIDPDNNMPEKAVFVEFFEQHYKPSTSFDEYLYSYTHNTHNVHWKRDTPVLWIDMTPSDPKFGDKVNITLNASLVSNRTLPNGTYNITLQEDKQTPKKYSAVFTSGIGKIVDYQINTLGVDGIFCFFDKTNKYNEYRSNHLEFNVTSGGNNSFLRSIFSLYSMNSGSFNSFFTRTSFNSAIKRGGSLCDKIL